MKLIFAIFIIIVVVLSIVFLINYLIEYFGQYTGDKVAVLSFDEFYKYYKINPNSWVVGYYELEKIRKEKNYSYFNIRCRIKFTSYWRYHLFVWSLKHNKKEKKQKEAYIGLLEDVQKDIDNCKAEAKEWNKQGVDMLDKILTK